MRYLLSIALLFLVGCGEQHPGTTEIEITKMVEYNYGSNTRIEGFSSKHGVLYVHDSPYFRSLKIGQKITVGCSDIEAKGGPTGCHVIIGNKNEQNEKR